MASGTRLLTVASATILIATETLATAVAAGWAVASLFNLGQLGQYGLMGLFSVLAIYITIVYLRRAAAVELSSAG